MLTLKSGDEDLLLRAVDVAAIVSAGLARVEVLMTFYNHRTGSNLEGELDFPLPEQATVSGYSLEHAGRLVPASVVEKEKARIAFEQEVRAGGTASLVEVVKGNSFKIRVYPLPPAHDTRVLVTFVTPLDPAGDSQLSLLLPFKSAAPVHSSLLLHYYGPGQPILSTNVAPLAASFKNAETVVADGVNLDTIQILVPAPAVGSPANVFVADKEGDTYFLVDDTPELKEIPAPAAKKEGKFLVMWDASFSFQGVDRSRELELIGKILNANASSAGLVVFRNVQEPTREFPKAAFGDLVQTLKEEPCDGGTDIEGLKFPEGYSKILWFTDGLSTLSNDIPSSLPQSPIYIFVSSAKSSIKTLTSIANKSGGAVYNLNLNPDDTPILTSISQGRQLQLLQTSCVDGSISDVFPSGRMPLAPGDSVKITGKLKSDTAQVKLVYGYSATEIVYTTTTTLAKANSIGEDQFFPLFWAQKKVDELAQNQDENLEQLIALGRKFGIVTPGSSLLVLTTLEQYLKHNITPSRASLPDVYVAYTQARQVQERTDEERVKAKLDKVRGWWQSRQSWYSKDCSAQQKTLYKPIWEMQNIDPNDLPRNPSPEASRRCSTGAKCESASCGAGAPPPPCPGGAVMKMKKCSAGPPPLAPCGAAPPPSLQCCAPPPPPCASACAPPAECEQKCCEKESTPAPEPEPVVPAAGGAGAQMKLKAWVPTKEYLIQMGKLPTPAAQYKEYLAQRENQGQSPAFYLDCAHFFFQQPATKYLGARVISTLADLKLEDPRLLRIVAAAMTQEQALTQAKWLYERVAKLRPEEPQSFRELGQTLVALGDFEKGIETLWKVITGPWETRFQHIEDEVLLDINRSLWLATKANKPVKADYIPRDFIQLMPMDIHCTITWDTDDTCIDLHIDQPAGGRCYYGSNNTAIGGWSTPDYPGCTAYSTSMLREYMIKVGFPGKYTLACNYYSKRRQDLTGATIIWFTVFTNYCTDKEEKLVTTLRLESNSTSPTTNSSYTIGDVQYGVGPSFKAYGEEWTKEYNAKGIKTRDQKQAEKTASAKSDLGVAMTELSGTVGSSLSSSSLGKK